VNACSFVPKYAIPPYMLEQIRLHGPDELRTAAAEWLARSDSLRSERIAVQSRIASGELARPEEPVSDPAVVGRRVFDARGSEVLPGGLVRREGDPPTGDPAVDEAFAGAGLTYFFYRDEYGRNSIDDRGLGIDSTVHFGTRFNNAFWTGRQMVYGDGDGFLFTRFTKDLDIIAHELGHGVIQYEANLDYQFQSGSLHESFADVLASMVKQRSYGQEARDADWLIGANVLLGEGCAMRSLKAPGTAYRNHPVLGNDPQGATMDAYQGVPFHDDRGGVHLNSGIPNHAFYVTAMELGGYAWQRAGRIWYRALSDYLGRDADFPGAAMVLVQVARDEFGQGSREEKAVEKGWREVKVL
jgi:Zn-dependent metalloprotease